MNDQFGARFTVIEQIGGGNYGTLFRVIDGEADSLADRIIATKKLKDAINHPHVLREVSVQRNAQQCTRHVAKLLHVVPRDHVRAALVLEYVPLDLRSFLNTFYCDSVSSSAPTWCATENGDGPVNGLPPVHVPLPYIRRLLRGLVEALHCLHVQGIAHRDVKPENILVEPLGLDHPLRCVCPTATRSEKTDDKGAPCWIHARRGDGQDEQAAQSTDAESSSRDRHRDPLSDSMNNNNNARCGSHSSSTNGGSKVEDVLEPCRCFFGTSVTLHHELTGEELTRAIHRLHCTRCRDAARATTAEEPTNSASSATGQPTPAVDEEQRQREDEQQEQWRQPFESAVAGAASNGSEEEIDEEAKREVKADSSPPLSPDIKLCDFGSARHIGTLRLRSAEEQREELTPGPTTPVYCAPEMMLLQRYGTAVDMWAVGAILFEMLTGEFFLSVGTLRSFYGDLVVHDDYCVMHRLNMMFHHLGTPTPEEWRSIAHPTYYPAAMLPHLPQIKGAALFSSLSSRTPPHHHNGNNVHSSSHCSTEAEECAETAVKGAAVGAEQANEEESRNRMGKQHTRSATATTTSSTHTEASAERVTPDLSEFLFRHVGVCGLDFLRSLLRYNPAERITAKEALQHPFLRDDNSASVDNAEAVD